MFSATGNNESAEVVWWKDGTGKTWAQACTAAATVTYGSKPFEPTFAINGTAARQIIQ